jgi:hypothetical protein
MCLLFCGNPKKSRTGQKAAKAMYSIQKLVINTNKTENVFTFLGRDLEDSELEEDDALYTKISDEYKPNKTENFLLFCGNPKKSRTSLAPRMSSKKTN